MTPEHATFICLSAIDPCVRLSKMDLEAWDVLEAGMPTSPMLIPLQTQRKIIKLCHYWQEQMAIANQNLSGQTSETPGDDSPKEK